MGQELYEAFARYRHPTGLAGCPCCTSAEQGRRLLASPLRSLSADALGTYAFKAITTWGSVQDYKYFLPRILDLTAAGEAPCDIEVTLGKLACAEFGTWPQTERVVVERFVASLFERYAQQFAMSEADALLCGAAKIMDVVPLLERAAASTEGFRSAFAAASARSDKRRLTNSYWDRESGAY